LNQDNLIKSKNIFNGMGYKQVNRAALPLLVPNKRVGVWIRTSTDLDSQKESPEHHLEKAKGYCLFKDWEIVEVYDLSATSGKSILNLPQTKQMISDIESGKIKCLIFSKLTRLCWQ